MLPFTVRSVISTVAACLFLAQILLVIPVANAANQIVVLRGRSLDGEGTPFEEPEDDGTPKLPYFDGDSPEDSSRDDVIDDAKHLFGAELVQKWIPLLSWYARIRF